MKRIKDKSKKTDSLWKDMGETPAPALEVFGKLEMLIGQKVSIIGWKPMLIDVGLRQRKPDKYEPTISVWTVN